jgi:hypothetical protein
VSRHAFDAHMIDLHRRKFSAAELPGLAEICEKHTLPYNMTRCPFCHRSIKNARTHHRHVAQHLEDLVPLLFQSLGHQSDERNAGQTIQHSQAKSSSLSNLSHQEESSDRSSTFSTASNLMLGTKRDAHSSEDDVAVLSSKNMMAGSDPVSNPPRPKRRQDSSSSSSDDRENTDFSLWPTLSSSKKSSHGTAHNAYSSNNDATVAPSKNTVSDSEPTPDFQRHRRRPNAISKIPVRHRSSWPLVPSRLDHPGSWHLTERHLQLEPCCAICTAPAQQDCAHEEDRLRIALDQAQDRWVGVKQIRYVGCSGRRLSAG